jgi:hypothetical protein
MEQIAMPPSPPPPEKPVRAGKATFRIPESASVEVALAVNPPDFPTCGFVYTVEPLM